MKKLLSLLAVAYLSTAAIDANAQDDKSKRPSPPAEVSQKISSGATITINYSQPSVKGRVIGKDLEPFKDKVWRTGANEATTFTTDQPLKINGSTLPAGKYALFSMPGDATWTIIFSKKADQWGAYDYKESDDALRTSAAVAKADPYAEKLSFTISKDGLIALHWGAQKVSFSVQ